MGGKEYVDYVLGAGPMILGHGHPHVLDAIRRQLSRGTTFYTLNEPAIALAEMVVRLVPCAEAVKFAASGSEATFQSLRLARAFTGRNLILKLAGGYHGNHDYAQQSISTIYDERGQFRAGPESRGIPAQVTDTVVVAGFNELESVERAVKEYQEDLAAIIVEPIQRSLTPDPGFLEGVREVCDRSGALMIFDEVVTGFRVGLAGAQGLYGVVPDLCALGKILGGGLPLGAVAGRREILELSVPDEQGRATRDRVALTGTFNGNPLSAAAGVATLEVLAASGTYEQLEDYGSRLVTGLSSIGDRLSVPLEVLGVPTIIDIALGNGRPKTYREYLASDRRSVTKVKLNMITRGIFVNPWARIYVSVAHTDRDLELTLEAAEAELTAVRDAGDPV